MTTGMRKYIYRLIYENIEEEKSRLKSTESILKNRPNDDYWTRKKQSIEGKIERATKYKELFSQVP